MKFALALFVLLIPTLYQTIRAQPVSAQELSEREIGYKQGYSEGYQKGYQTGFDHKKPEVEIMRGKNAPLLPAQNIKTIAGAPAVELRPHGMGAKKGGNNLPPAPPEHKHSALGTGTKSTYDRTKPCDGDNDPLKESLGCLTDWSGEATAEGGVEAIVKNRSYGGEIIILEAFVKTEDAKLGGSIPLWEEISAMLENFRQLKIEHYIIAVEELSMCDWATEILRSATVLSDTQALSCTFVNVSKILPGVDWDRVCYPNIQGSRELDWSCRTFVRWLLAQHLKDKGGLNVLSLDLDVTLAVNPYAGLNAPGLDRHTGIMMQMPWNCGIMYFGGCDGAKEGTGAWVLNKFRQYLIEWMGPDVPGIRKTNLMDEEKLEYGRTRRIKFPALLVPHACPTCAGMHVNNGTILVSIWEQTFLQDIILEAMSGVQRWCNTRVRDPWITAEQFQEWTQECYDTLHDGWKELRWDADRTGVNWSEFKLLPGGESFGPYGALVRQRVEQADKKEFGEKVFESYTGDFCADGKRDSILLSPEWLADQSRIGTPSIMNHWVNTKLTSWCMRKPLRQLQGWYGGHAMVPGVTLPKIPKLLVLSGDWLLPHSSFERWLAEVHSFIEMGDIAGRRAVLPHVPCDAFGESPEWFDKPQSRKREYMADCTHGINFMGPSIPGSPIQEWSGKREPNMVMFGCDTGIEGEGFCDLAVPCKCIYDSGGKGKMIGMVAYQADLKALLENPNGRFGEDGQVTTQEVVVQVPGRHETISRDQIADIFSPYSEVNVVYITPSHNRSGVPMVEGNRTEFVGRQCVGNPKFYA